MCYYGKRTGEPTVLAPGWAAAEAIGCKGQSCKKNKCCGGSPNKSAGMDEL